MCNFFFEVTSHKFKRLRNKILLLSIIEMLSPGELLISLFLFYVCVVYMKTLVLLIIFHINSKIVIRIHYNFKTGYIGRKFPSEFLLGTISTYKVDD